MQVSLEQQASVLSMEAFNFRASLTSLTSVLPEYVTKVKAAFAGYMANDIGTINLVPEFALNKITKDLDYAAHRKTQVYGPAGLKVSYLEYLAAIGAAVDITSDFHASQVRVFMNWVNHLLASPEELSTSGNVKCPIRYTEKDLDQVKSQLEKCVNRASNQTMFEYSKLVRQNGDWATIVAKTNGLITQYMTTNRKEMLNDIENITSSLERLTQRIKEDPELYKVSGVTMAELAKQCLSVARTVEFYSITGYLVAELSGTVSETLKGVQRLV